MANVDLNTFATFDWDKTVATLIRDPETGTFAGVYMPRAMAEAYADRVASQKIFVGIFNNLDEARAEGWVVTESETHVLTVTGYTEPAPDYDGPGRIFVAATRDGLGNVTSAIATITYHRIDQRVHTALHVANMTTHLYDTMQDAVRDGWCFQQTAGFLRVTNFPKQP